MSASCLVVFQMQRVSKCCVWAPHLSEVFLARLSPDLLFDDEIDDYYDDDDEDDYLYLDYTCDCQHGHQFTDDQLRENKFRRPQPRNGESSPAATRLGAPGGETRVAESGRPVRSSLYRALRLPRCWASTTPLGIVPGSGHAARSGQARGLQADVG